jgi:hypothetical protein
MTWISIGYYFIQVKVIEMKDSMLETKCVAKICETRLGKQYILGESSWKIAIWDTDMDIYGLFEEG